MKGKTRASNRSSLDKEGKREAAINQSIRKVNCGDLLWVQLHGSSWWPAQIVDHNTISAIHKPRERRKGEVPVRLYGSYKYLFIDPISCHFDFEDTLNKYNGSHYAILKEALKQDLHRLKFGTSKKKEMKIKGKVGADACQERMVKQKQNIISKTGTRKVPSPVCSSSRELDANSPAKRSKETSIGSTKENGSRKRKNEETQKSKSNSTKTASRKQEQEMESKKTKTDDAVSLRTSSERLSAGDTPKTSVKRVKSLSDKSEQGENKMQKQSGTEKNLRPNSPNSKLSTPKQNHGHSLSAKLGSSKGKVQAKNAVEKKLGKSISQANKDAGRKKNAKASKQEIVSTTLEENAKEPSARKLKVMRTLGLIAPAGSPFIQNGSIFGST